MLDAAFSLDALGNLRGNRLHAVKDDRAGQHGISTNAEWRIRFVWNGDAYGVELSTTTDSDWLDNAHVGQVLVTEFVEPERLSVERLAGDIAVVPKRIHAVIESARPVDAE